GEELARIGAAPVRCGDGNIRVVLADATPERIAGIREHFSGGIEIGVVTPSKLASLLDGASMAAVSNNHDSVASGAAAAAPVWGRSLERVLGLFGAAAIYAGGDKPDSDPLGVHEPAAAPRQKLWGRKSRLIAELQVELAATAGELEEHRQACANLAVQLSQESEAARLNEERL